ncbi:hypothetical protein F5Y18DRAFT_422332 [Xylariaceae sp. FL1019]|nr:hypothetical protein F5Y18DRAFT_422332 [Xylariaceae sp. FL1019]
MQPLIVLLALAASGANAWGVGFYNQCRDEVSPGYVEGSGTKGCEAVDNADCMNGHAGDDLNGGGPTLFICGYAAANCGHENGYTSLDNVGGHAIINDGSNVKNIVSWGITNDPNCGPAT